MAQHVQLFLPFLDVLECRKFGGVLVTHVLNIGRLLIAYAFVAKIVTNTLLSVFILSHWNARTHTVSSHAPESVEQISVRVTNSTYNLLSRRAIVRTPEQDLTEYERAGGTESEQETYEEGARDSNI